MTRLGPIFLISGTPGAGKSTVAKTLVRRFTYGLHVPVDDLREFVVSGLAGPVPAWTEETGRQFRLARHAACDLARRYAAAGFAVAIADVVGLEARDIFDADLERHAFHKVVLRPPLEVALKRNRERKNKPFDTSILETAIRQTYTFQQPLERAEDWLVVDSNDLSIEQTVDAILERLELTPHGDAR